MNFMMSAALFFARLLEVYSFLIWVRIILSWIRPYPRVGSFTYYIARIVDPYLNLFRSDKARIGMLDFSPIIAIGILSVVQSLLSVFGYYGFLTLGMILSSLILAFWTYGVSIFLFFSIMILIFRTIASFTHNPMMYASMNSLHIMDPISNMVRKCFTNRIPKDSTVSMISLVITVALYFVIKRIFLILATLALQLPI